MLSVALSKGKMFDDSVQLLRRAGLLHRELVAESRQLAVEDGPFRFILARARDVPTYVEYGAAQLGVVGKDVLLESPDSGVAELLDLGFGYCRFVLAGPPQARSWETQPGKLRVATKFPRMTEEFLARRGKSAQIIVLHGSVELAPALGLADLIVDLVSTGRTLRENGLVELESLAEATARLVANPVSFRLRAREVATAVAALRTALGREGDGR